MRDSSPYSNTHVVTLNILPVRLMVGHLPLEQGIGVRVPDRQQIERSYICYREKALGELSSGTRKPEGEPCHWGVLFIVFTPTPPRLERGHRIDHDEIEDVLPRVKLSELPYVTHKGIQIARSHCRRVSKLFAKKEIQDYLEANDVHHSDITAAASI